MIKKIPRVALVYDWVDTKYGGAEKVLLNLHQIFPDAPLFTSIFDPDQADWAKDFQVRVSFLQKFPKILRNHKLLIFLMGLAFESFDFSQFDLIISVSSGPAKGIITTPDQFHINYCLTPPRYLYSHRQRYLNQIKFGKLWIIDKLTNWSLNYLCWWDTVASSRPDIYIPISQVVKKRVEDIYQRKCAEVIYPPLVPLSLGSSSSTSADRHLTLNQRDDLLDLNSLSNKSKNLDYYLVVCRLVDYKRVDVAIKACESLGRKLIIVGKGEQKKRLQSISKSAMTIFVDSVTQEKLAKLYSQAKALIMVGAEDFGITGLEAMSYGVPVLVNQSSGVAELITDGQMGIHLIDENVSVLKKAIIRLESISFDRSKLRERAEQFDQENFKHTFYHRCMMLYDELMVNG